MGVLGWLESRGAEQEVWNQTRAQLVQLAAESRAAVVAACRALPKRESCRLGAHGIELENDVGLETKCAQGDPLLHSVCRSVWS